MEKFIISLLSCEAPSTPLATIKIETGSISDLSFFTIIKGLLWGMLVAFLALEKLPTSFTLPSCLLLINKELPPQQLASVCLYLPHLGHGLIA